MFAYKPSELNIVYFDIKTTNFGPIHGRDCVQICEIGALTHKPRKQFIPFNENCLPFVPINEEIGKIHGVTTQGLAETGVRPIHTVLDAFSEFIWPLPHETKTILVSHGDHKPQILMNNFKKFNCVFPKDIYYFDARKIVQIDVERWDENEMKDFSLPSCLEYYSYDEEQEKFPSDVFNNHRSSLVDACNTYKVCKMAAMELRYLNFKDFILSNLTELIPHIE